MLFLHILFFLTSLLAGQSFTKNKTRDNAEDKALRGNKNILAHEKVGSTHAERYVPNMLSQITKTSSTAVPKNRVEARYMIFSQLFLGDDSTHRSSTK